jgi:DNA-binding LacI/PurR family transcriptional regulator
VAGVKAFELLMDRIEGRANGRYRRLVNPAKLFVRKSTQDKEDRR